MCIPYSTSKFHKYRPKGCSMFAAANMGWHAAIEKNLPNLRESVRGFSLEVKA